MQTLNLVKNKHVVLVDGGYLLFYRWHATQRWIQFKKDPELMEDTAKHLDFFVSHLDSQLKKLTKTMKTVKENIVFCMDARRRSAWRHEVAEEAGIDYKGTRATGGIPDDLYAAYVGVLERFGSVVRVDRLEADDIAALLLRKIPEEFGVTIVTSDHDYLQLKKRPGVELVDAGLKPLKGASEDPEVNLWIKIFMGDPSDNIPSAVPRCGKKTALKLASDPVKREETIEKHRDLVELNRALVDFDMIPGELVAALEAAVEVKTV